MDLETRTKKLITDIIEPLRNRMTEDSKTALRYTSRDAFIATRQNTAIRKIEERLKLLEAAVFQSDRSETLFDAIEKRVE